MLASTDRPPTELNAETMARYKEELKKYYYDPSRYGTYLEQLGIKFPTLAKPASTQ
jgi:aminobenzoyl-glutamate utilization protein B